MEPSGDRNPDDPGAAIAAEALDQVWIDPLLDRACRNPDRRPANAFPVEFVLLGYPSSTRRCPRETTARTLMKSRTPRTPAMRPATARSATTRTPAVP